MGTKAYKPTTHSRRWMTGHDFKDISRDEPQRSLLSPVKRTGGRNNAGRVTVRHIGGGHKRMYRQVDFKRDIFDVAAKVLTIEYDPNRTARLALVEYPDKQKRYILAPLGLKPGDEVISAKETVVEAKPGNCLRLKNIPSGTMIHNLELSKGKGGQIVRSAGTCAQITAKEGDHVHIKMPSGEIRMFSMECRASIGQLSNVEHDTIVIGKAGRTRWMGVKPTVRGSAMNPHDHPHGGGEGKAGQGNPHPVTPWGKPTKGYRTRKHGIYSDKFIVKRRN
ncbi:MAG: 50S ribosomal protein L2 [Candidatus Omnitrophota bacterium]